MQPRHAHPDQEEVCHTEERIRDGEDSLPFLFVLQGAYEESAVCHCEARLSLRISVGDMDIAARQKRVTDLGCCPG